MSEIEGGGIVRELKKVLIMWDPVHVFKALQRILDDTCVAVSPHPVVFPGNAHLQREG